MADKLRAGDRLPEATLNLVGGGALSLPGSLDTDFGVLLLYRGHW